MSILAVDAGKFATKALNGNKEKAFFRTKSTTLTNKLDIEAAGNSHKVTYEGVNYIIGDQGEDIDFGVEKNTLVHKLAIYVAAHKLKSAGSTNVVIGCPSSIYLKKENRLAFQENVRSVPAGFMIDGEKPKFNFDKILIMPESSGVVLVNKDRFKGKRVGVIDLGGRNMNFGIYDNMAPVASSMITTNQGSMELERLIKRDFEGNYKRAFSLTDIEYIISNGGLMYQGQVLTESIMLLKEVYHDYCRDIVKTLNKDFTIDTMDIVITGGTSLLVEKILAEYIPHLQIVDDTQWSNADGFLEVAKAKLNG